MINANASLLNLEDDHFLLLCQCYVRCPQGNSNPCRSLERAVSWSSRRWRHVMNQLYFTQKIVSGQTPGLPNSFRISRKTSACSRLIMSAPHCNT
jgi:hypothetical protein